MKPSQLCRRYLFDFLKFSLFFTLAATVLVAFAAGVIHSVTARVATDADAVPRLVIVIDPGHGGEDGGASGTDGTLEKDLNLSVAAVVSEILSAAGYDVRMTRSDDRLLYDMYDDLSDYTGHKKAYDLRNRLRFAKEASAALFVSIHMNKFAQAQYSGLQVYYAPAVPQSETAATAVQNYAKLYLQPDNTRPIKAAGSSIYLLSRIDRPAILIECGFLSNAEELAHLQDPIYQKELALTIACAIAESMSAIGA